MRQVPLIIDAFCYNGEPIAIQHIEYLFDHVDAFIIVEARETFSGNHKPYLYYERNSKYFAPFASKIIYHVIDRFPEMPVDWPERNAKHPWMVREAYPSWWRETYQRDAIYQAYRQHFSPQTKAILICADCDEVPRLTAIHALRRENMYERCDAPIFLEMQFFYYSTKWMKPYPWYKAFILNDAGMARFGLSDCRVNIAVTRYLPNAGWHFSYFLSVDQLQEKLSSFSHRECDKKEFSNEAHIEACFASGKDLFGRTGLEDLQSTPSYILQDVPVAFGSARQMPPYDL